MNFSPGLVLTGGGARAAYQVGALKALAEILPTDAIPFRTICGTSAGAINAAYLAARAESWPQAAQSLSQLWETLGLDDVYRTDSISLSQIAVAWISRTVLGGRVGTRKRANYLLNTSPLWSLLQREVDFAAIRQNIDNGTLNGVGFSSVQYFAGLTVSFFDASPQIEPWLRSNRLGLRRELTAAHVMASAAIPVFFPPVEISGEYYGDGCLRQTTPLSPAIHLGADRILSIGIRHENRRDETALAARTASRHSPSLAEIAGELMNSLFLDSLEADVERMERINQSIVAMTPAQRGELRPIPILQLRPSRDLGGLVPDVLKAFPVTLRYLFKGLGASSGEGRELVSYLAFIEKCVSPLMRLGYQDTLDRRGEITRFMQP